eukprot:6209083-Pleurochrysis_carterae.AAC.2
MGGEGSAERNVQDGSVLVLCTARPASEREGRGKLLVCMWGGGRAFVPSDTSCTTYCTKLYYRTMYQRLHTYIHTYSQEELLPYHTILVGGAFCARSTPEQDWSSARRRNGSGGAIVSSSFDIWYIVGALARNDIVTRKGWEQVETAGQRAFWRLPVSNDKRHYNGGADDKCSIHKDNI